MTDTPFTTFAYAATGAPTTRTTPDRLTDVINVLEYGADPNRELDSSDAIDLAMAAAATKGDNLSTRSQHGATLFFPPGTYKVTRPIIPATNLSIIGSGPSQTIIYGDLDDPGWVLDQSAYTVTSSGAALTNATHITLVDSTNVSVGMTIRDNFEPHRIPVETVVEDVDHDTGIVTMSNALVDGVPDGSTIEVNAVGQFLRVEGLSIVNTDYIVDTGCMRHWNVTAAVLEQVFFYGYNGYDGTVNNFDLTMIGCSSTGSNFQGTGIACAGDMVSCVAFTHDIGIRVSNAGTRFHGHVERCHTGIFVGGNDGIGNPKRGGGQISVNTMEDCDIFLDLYSAGSLNVSGGIGGCGGIGQGAEGISFTGSISGSTLTVTGYTGGGGGLWLRAGLIITATDYSNIDNTQIVSYDSGGTPGGNGVYTVTNSQVLVCKTFFVAPTRGIRVGDVQTTTIDSVGVTGALFSIAGVDMASADPIKLTFINMDPNYGEGVAWKMPDPRHNVTIRAINCRGLNLATTFANLPGGSALHETTAEEGMEFNITDGTNGLACGDICTNTGTHTTHYKVRYNGTNWTVVGK